MQVRSFGIGLCCLSSAFAQATMVYVPDINSNSVLKFDATTGEYKGIIGAGFLNNPLNLEQNPNDNRLYVTSIGRVVRLDPYTGEYLGLVGSGFLEFPDDITFGSDGTMYVTDLKSTGTCILKFNPVTGEYKGIIATGFLGNPSWGSCLEIAADDTVYVIGAGGTAIQKFNGVTGE